MTAPITLSMMSCMRRVLSTPSQFSVQKYTEVGTLFPTKDTVADRDTLNLRAWLGQKVGQVSIPAYICPANSSSRAGTQGAAKCRPGHAESARTATLLQ